MQTLLIKKKLIECFKLVTTLTSEKECRCVLKTDGNILELLFSTSKERNCIIEWVFVAHDCVELVNPLNREKNIYDYVGDPFIELIPFILSIKIQELKEIMCIVEEIEQTWSFIVNSNGSRSIKIISSKLEYIAPVNYDLSFNNCISHEHDLWINLGLNLEKIDQLFNIHNDVSNTNYNKVIGSYSTLLFESINNKNIISITSTNGRIMINSLIFVESFNNDKKFNNDEECAKVLIPKSLKKIFNIIDNCDENNTNNVLISFNNKTIKFKYKNCKLSLSRLSAKDNMLLKSLYEFNNFNSKISVEKSNFMDITRTCKSIRKNINDMSDVEIYGEKNQKDIYISCASTKKERVIKKNIKSEHLLDNSFNLKTGHDVMYTIGSIFSTLTLDSKSIIEIDTDPSIPYARIKTNYLNTNIFFVLIK